jgi:hypothetical protein
LSQDTNVFLIQKAIETKTKIILTPRRTHTIKGTPINFEENTLRVYVNTGKNVESVLISEVAHFSFPVELWDMIGINNIVHDGLKLPDGLKPNPHGEPDAESLKEYAKKHPHKEETKT